MVLIGLLYLAFEDYVLSGFSNKPKQPSARAGHLSRIITGVQVGLILLAILVTRSSALSLQAKQGLPRGNQILGWLILGN